MAEPVGGLPPLVAAAQSAAIHAGFTRSCTDAFGRLLRVFAAASPGPVAELGTGCGVGAAWLAGGLRPGVPLYTVESDLEHVKTAASVLEGERQIHLLNGDWRSVLPHGPFALLFPDCPGTKELTDEIAGCIAVGGGGVIDDLTPPWSPQPENRARRG